MHRAFILLLVITFAPPVAAEEPTPHAEATFVGSSVFDGPRLTLNWNAYFDAPLPQVVKRITTWSNSARIMGEIVEFKLHESEAETAKFWVERKAPFFIANPEIMVRARITSDTTGAQLLWTRLGGTLKHFRKSWKLTSKGGGTWVEHSMEIQLPVDPPKWARPNPAKILRRDVERFREVVGATRAAPSP